MLEYQGIKEKINSTKIDPHLLGEVMHMLGNLPTESRDIFEIRATKTYTMLVKKGCPDSAIAALAITARLMALDAVLDDPQVKSLMITDDKPGMVYLHYDILRAATQEPVVEDANGQPIFVVEKFRKRLLKLAGSGGCA
jgi:hypothetical protein